MPCPHRGWLRVLAPYGNTIRIAMSTQTIPAAIESNRMEFAPARFHASANRCHPVMLLAAAADSLPLLAEPHSV